MAADISLTNVYGDGQDLIVQYDVANEDAPAFNVGFFASGDGVSLDTLLFSQRIDEPVKLTAQTGHIAAFSPNFIDVQHDYFLIAVVDVGSEVTEADESNNSRLLQSGVFQAVDGTVHVHGSASDDEIDVRQLWRITVKLNGTNYEFARNAVSELHIRTHDGDDVARAGISVRQPVWGFGGLGNDVLYGGIKDDYLDGSLGDDRLVGRLGDDELLGRTGDDTLLGDAGNDNLYGGEGDDLLDGNLQADLLDGGAGNDTLDGGFGDDTLLGADGEDDLTGRVGADQLDGGPDDDSLDGRIGDDTLLGDAGNDVLLGGIGADRLYGDDGCDSLNGQFGDDALFGGRGDDVLVGGGQGGDVLDGGTGANALDGTPDGQPSEGCSDNTPPTTAGINDIDVFENAPDTVIDLFAAFDDAEDPDSALTYEIFSNTNPALFTSTSIDAAVGTLSLDFAPNTSGDSDLTLRATDTGGLFVDTSFTVSVIHVVPAPVITGIDQDTGPVSNDGVTSDNTLVLSGTSQPASTVTLSESGLGVVGTTTSDFAGDWSVDATSRELADGTYSFTATAQVLGGPLSPPSLELTVTVDTEAPSILALDLDPMFDTGAQGDLETTLDVVNVIGQTDAFVTAEFVETGQTAVADATGQFQLTSVPLLLGRHAYTFELTDAAGNVAQHVREITRDQPILLAEGNQFLTQTSVDVDLSQSEGTRTISCTVEANFDESGQNASAEDTLLLYLVDPADPSQTLLDRGENGTAIFSLAGGRAEYVPGLVGFDGSVARIDVTSAAQPTGGTLVFQLLNLDGDNGTQIEINSLSNAVDPDGMANVVFARQRPAVADPGGPLNLTSLNPSQDVDVLLENVRFDSAGGRYSAELRVLNNGSAIGRSVAVVFPNLPAGVSLLNESGVDATGAPYVSMQEGIARGGLAADATSDAVRLELDNPGLVQFTLAAQVLDAGPNQAPVFDPVGALNVRPGEYLEVPLSATDADGDTVTFALSSMAPLPTGVLKASGRLIFTPSPSQLGTYQFELIARDGALEASQTVTLNVQADPVTTTRISGLVLNTAAAPLPGIPVELDSQQTTTAADGSFQLEFATPPAGDTLIIRGEQFAGSEVYPFIAEKLPLVLGHGAYDNVNNVIARPIYLPALDVANGVTIDPAVDTTVTTPTISGASVLVAAGSLEDQQGGPFTGVLSITEVPRDLTPAALPTNLFPDIVVTIQPGEMVFTTPAPLTLPNLSGYVAGTSMDLWSINPQTGLFDNVGTGQVSTDGATIETISGGIRNSSWHFFSPGGPQPDDPDDNPRNQDDGCDECEERDQPNSDSRPSSGRNPISGGAPGSSGSPSLIDQPSVSERRMAPQNMNLDDGSSDQDGTSSRPRTGGGGKFFSGGMTLQANTPVSRAQSTSASTTTTRQNMARSSEPAVDTQVALHSGSVVKGHELVPYQSLGVVRGLALRYDSERADPRPIVHFGYNNTQSNLPDPGLVSRLTVSRGDFKYEVPGFTGSQPGLTGGEHFFKVSPADDQVDAALQVDMRSQPTGRYDFEVTSRFSGFSLSQLVGTAATSDGQLLHVNTIDSPFGAGWGLVGLEEVVENPDGSVLIVNGDGGEQLFEPPLASGQPYVSPTGDFTVLEKLLVGTFQRTYKDQTVQLYSATNKLQLIRDRNGNETQFIYDAADQLIKIIDPVGLETTFTYGGGKVTAITDPAGRATTLKYGQGNLVQIDDPDTTSRRFEYDSAYHMTADVDKRGNREEIVYDFAGRVTQVGRKDGSTTQYAPVQSQGLYRPEQTIDPATAPPVLPQGRSAVADMADANGNVTRKVLDQSGQLVSAVDGAGSLPSVTRDEDNLIVRAQDARGHQSDFEYDHRGNLIEFQDEVSRASNLTPLFPNRIYQAGGSPDSIASGDVNNDGLLDLITTNGTSSISVFLGRGDGSFGFRTDFPMGSLPRHAALADMNGDGTLDVLTANRTGNSVSIRLGNGDGTFASRSDFTTGNEPNFVAIADLNGDTLPDAITANSASNTVSVFLGNGDGTLNTHVTFPVGNRPSSVAVGDVDSNGTLDLVVPNHLGNNLSVLPGNGDGSFAAAAFVSLGSVAPESAVLADLNGDEALDVIAGGDGQAFAVLIGNGDGTFGPQTNVALLGPGSSSAFPSRSAMIAVGDVDNDNDQDVVFVEPTDDIASVFVNDGSGVLTAAATIAVGNNPVSVTLGDANLDRLIDIMAVNKTGNSVSAVLGNGDGTFVVPPAAPPDLPVGDRPRWVHVVDIDRDNNADLLTANQNGDVSVLIGNGDGSFAASSSVPAGTDPRFVTSADVDDDGNFDLLVANFNADRVSVLLGDGSGGFSAPAPLAVADGPLEIAVDDLNGDDKLDLVVTGNRTGGGTYSVLIGNGDGTFAPAVNTVSNYNTASLALGDLNGDTLVDLVLGQAAASIGNRVAVHLGLGDGTFAPGVTYGVNNSVSFAGPVPHVALADLDEDGRLDVVAADASTPAVGLLRGRGDGTFETVVRYAVADDPRALAVGDLDGDGLLDVISAGDATDRVSILSGQGDGTLGNRADFLVGNNPFSVGLADLDEDGDLDFVTANLDADSVSVRFNSTFDDVAGAPFGPRRFTYDPVFSQLTSITDELGRELLMDVDPVTGDRLSVTQVVGPPGSGDDVVTQYTYTPAGQIDTTTDALGRVTDYQYDSRGRLTQVTYAVGTLDEASQSYEYDNAGNRTALIDELGHRTEYQYDAMNRLTRLIEADPDGPGPQLSPVTQYEYDEAGNLTSVTDALNNVDRYDYDQQHRLISWTDPIDNVTTYAYDASGNVASMVDRLGRETQYVYDDRNRLVETIDAESGRERRFYDGDNNLVRIIDKNGNPTTYVYDARDRLTRAVDAHDSVVTFDFDQVNNLVATTDELGRLTQFAYDVLNRQIEATRPDPDGAGPESAPLSQFAYDKAHNTRFVIDALGNTTEYRYDNRNRLIEQIDPDPDGAGPLASPTTTFEYDVANRLVVVTDPLSRETRYEFDDLNRRTREIAPDPDGGGPDPAPQTTFTYDAVGNELSMTDALGNVTQYDHDDLYRLTTLTEPDPDGAGPQASPVTTYVYDAEGQLFSVSDPLGRTTTYQYDLLGRPVQETSPDPDGPGPGPAPLTTFTYDAVGNRLSLTDPLGNVTQYEYDKLHRVVKTIAADPDGAGPEINPVTRFKYDVASQLLSVTDALGRKIEYQHDALGRLVRETRPDPDAFGPDTSPVMTYSFDLVDNQLSMTDALGNVTQYQYDNLYRRIKQIDADPDDAGPQSNPESTFAFDAASQLLSVTDPLGRSTSFQYDNLGRVTRQIDPDPDGAGPLASPESTRTYDLVDNQLATTDPLGNVTQFQYDNLYRLVAVVEADPDGPGPLATPVSTYTYDAGLAHLVFG